MTASTPGRLVGVDLGTKPGIAIWAGAVPRPADWLKMPPEYDLLDNRPRGHNGGPAMVDLLDCCSIHSPKLALSPGEGGGMRSLRWRRALLDLLDPAHPGGPVRQLGYELVQHHTATWAAQIYGELRGELMKVCEELAIPYHGVPVSTVKRVAAGSGNAPKTLVAARMVDRFKPYSARLRDPIKKAPTLDETDALGVLAVVIQDHQQLGSSLRQAG